MNFSSLKPEQLKVLKSAAESKQMTPEALEIVKTLDSKSRQDLVDYSNSYKAPEAPATAAAPEATQATDPVIGINAPDTTSQKIGKAVIGGVGQGIVNSGEGIANTMNFFLQNLGRTSPETAQKAYDIIHKTAKKLSPSETKTFGPSMQEYPEVAGVAKLVPELYAGIKGQSLIASGASKTLSGLEKGTKAVGLGKYIPGAGKETVSQMVGAGAVSMAASSPENQAIGGVLGAASIPVLNIAGAGVKQLAKLGIVKNWLKKQLEPINKYIAENNLLSSGDAFGESIHHTWTVVDNAVQEQYTKLKSITELKYMQPVVVALRNASKARLDDPQKNIVLDVLDQVKAAKNMDDLLTIHNIWSKKNKVFWSETASPTAKKVYNNVKQAIDDKIQQHAKKAGLESDWALAKKLHEDVIIPLRDFNAEEISETFLNKTKNIGAYNKALGNIPENALKSPEKLAATLDNMDEYGRETVGKHIITKRLEGLLSNPEEFSLEKAIKMINIDITKLGPTLGKNTTDMLKGVRDVMKESVVSTKGARTKLASTLGLSAGAAYAYQQDASPLMTIAAAGTGALAAPALLHTLILGSQMKWAQKLLEAVGNGSLGARKFADALKAAGAMKIGDATQPPGEE